MVEEEVETWVARVVIGEVDLLYKELPSANLL